MTDSMKDMLMRLLSDFLTESMNLTAAGDYSQLRIVIPIYETWRYGISSVGI